MIENNRRDPSRARRSSATAGEASEFPRLQAIADRGYRGLAKLAARKQPKLDIKAKPPGTKGFTPLVRSGASSMPSPSSAAGVAWRASTRAARRAKAWLEVASMGFLLGRV